MRRLLAVLAATWAAASLAWWVRGRRRKGRALAAAAGTPPAP
ncbi:MAG: hypothetical protein AB7O78_10390 [Thermoleophilia bacterium]